jgi:hypothetical protein
VIQNVEVGQNTLVKHAETNGGKWTSSGGGAIRHAGLHIRIQQRPPTRDSTPHPKSG